MGFLIIRIGLFLDIMGGFIMAIIVGLGWYARKEGMHITFVCYWGMMCLINGAFDLVKWIDQVVHSPFPVFSGQLPASYNVTSAIALAIPLSVLLGAPFAYIIYKSHTAEDTSEWSSRPSM